MKEIIKTKQVQTSSLRASAYNPRQWDKEAMEQLKVSIRRFGFVDPVIANSAKGREGIVIGGHMRLVAAKELGIKEVPVVYVNIPDIKREKELNVRLNRNTGEFDFEKLAAEFNESFLADIGFTSEEIDRIFPVDETPEVFDLSAELKKLNIEKIQAKTGDLYEIGPDFRLLVGDSMVEADMLKLMGGEKADMVCTDEPYVLDYTKGKKRHKATEGFGYKRDRKYLGTDTLPPDFMARWLANVDKVRKENFSILSYENWKNLKQMWEEMEKYFKIRNVIVWHVPNRVQGFSAKYKFFDKFDIAVVGTKGNVNLNVAPEEELFQNEYEAALFATVGKPHWEPYEKGKKYCPTDFIEHIAADEKNSGQGVVFGTKPVEILIPFIKVLTKRGDLVLEPFGGSASTAAAALKLGRRCYVMEKSPVYAEVIKVRIQRLTGLKAKKIDG
jgi:DNA modification methylase